MYFPLLKLLMMWTPLYLAVLVLLHVETVALSSEVLKKGPQIAQRFPSSWYCLQPCVVLKKLHQKLVW